MNEYNYASQGADYRVDYDPDLIAERPLQRRQRNERINDNSRDRGSDETDNGAKTSARRETTAPPKERNTRDTTARKRESKPRRAKRPWKEAGIVKFLCDKRFSVPLSGWLWYFWRCISPSQQFHSCVPAPKTKAW